MEEAPASKTTVAGLLVAAFSASVVCTGWIDASTTSTYRGRVAAHRSVVRAPASGPLLAAFMAEGTDVRAAARIGTIDDTSIPRELRELATAIAALDAEIARSDARADVEVHERQRDIDQDILETELRAAELLQRRFDEQLGDVAWSDLADWNTTTFPVVQPIAQVEPATTDTTSDELQNSEAVAALLKRERARNAAEVARVQLELCESRLSELKERREAIEEEVRSAYGVESLAIERTRLIEERGRLADRSPRTAVRAPGFGVIEEWMVRPGEDVRLGEPIARLADRERTRVELPVPSHAIGEFPPGLRVRIEFPGGTKRLGRVVDRPSRAVVRESERNDPTAESYLMLRIRPEGKLWPDVPLGTSVNVQPHGD